MAGGRRPAMFDKKIRTKIKYKTGFEFDELDER
jgi:hypothetical protein